MARRPARSSRKKTLGIPNLDNVEGRISIPEGEYLVKVSGVTTEEGDKAPYLAWKFEVAEGKSEGGTLYNNTSLSQKALFNVKTLLEALGVDSDPEDLAEEDVMDLELMVSVELETWEGKKRPKIVDFWPVEEAEPARGRGSRDKEEAEPARRGSKKDAKPARRGGKKEPELTQDDINEMDQEGLEEFVEDNKLEVDLGKLKTLRKMRAAVIDAAEEEKLLAAE